MNIRKLLDPRNLVPLASLLYSLAFAYRYLIRTLFRTWFFSSDEYVLAAEVIRFSNFDFRQHFFDNPGTFFMMVATPIWWAFYSIECALGLAPKTGIAPFTFEHIRALFVLIRATTVGCFLLSAVLFFVLVSRLLNPAAAALASLLLLMTPGYSSYSSFARTESLAMVLMLCAILWLLRDVERAPAGSASPPRTGDPALIAGILIGLAAGSRLHSVTASLPVLVILLWLRKPFIKHYYPAWVLKWSKLVLPASWAAAGLLMILAETRLQSAAGARQFVIAAAGVWIVASGAAFLFYRMARTRPLVVRLLSPDILKLGLGCGIGGILGNPTVLWQYNYFLGSVQMYSGYVDQERLSWPFWKNATWYFRHYIHVAAPDKITLVLLCAGTIAIVIARDHR